MGMRRMSAELAGGEEEEIEACWSFDDDVNQETEIVLGNVGQADFHRNPGIASVEKG